jgi:hypothetical protein
MAIHLGQTVADGPEAKVEYDAFTCGHCQRIIEVAHRSRPEDMGGLCKICMTLVCPVCNAAGRCTPWEKQLEQMEAREAARRSYGV